MSIGWVQDAEEDEALLSSAVAGVEFARSERNGLHPRHPSRLINDAIWFLTERGSPSRKYRLRDRTPAALQLQQALGMSGALPQLAHEPCRDHATRHRIETVSRAADQQYDQRPAGLVKAGCGSVTV